MSNQSKLIAKLQEREADIKAQIKAAQRKEAKKLADIQAHKARIIGAAVLAEMKTNTALKSSLTPIINKNTVNDKDRKLMGLSPLPKKESAPPKKPVIPEIKEPDTKEKQPETETQKSGFFSSIKKAN